MNYHRIILGVITTITLFGFVIPFVSVSYCDSIQIFDDSCFRPGGSRSPVQIAGAEIYYNFLSSYMNPYVVQDEQVFQLKGDMPEKYSDTITLQYSDDAHGVIPNPRQLLINLSDNPTVTIKNESNLDYRVLDWDFGTKKMLDTIPASNSESFSFSDVGVYSYRMEPVSEHDTRSMHIRIMVIDEHIEEIPESLRNQIACALVTMNHTKYTFFDGMSCGGNGEPIEISVDKSIRGASPEFKQEFLDVLEEQMGFLQPKVKFDYDLRRHWSIGFPLFLGGINNDN